MHNRFFQKVFAASISTTLLAGGALAADTQLEAAGRLYLDSEMRDLLTDQTLINAIKDQNSAHRDVTSDRIQELDKQWRREVEQASGTLVDEVLGNELSSLLKQRQAQGGGALTEVFVMDNKGLNVGQSDITSDYWQGDEAKWQKTFALGSDKIFVDEIEFDESSQTYQTQISASITDPQTGEVIGAITFGVDAEALMLQ